MVRTVWIVEGFTTGENVFEIDASPLSDPVNNPSSLIALQSSIRIQLMLENPFASDNGGTQWSVNQALGTIAL
jgi:hypothetical protein